MGEKRNVECSVGNLEQRKSLEGIHADPLLRTKVCTTVSKCSFVYKCWSERRFFWGGGVEGLVPGPIRKD